MTERNISLKPPVGQVLAWVTSHNYSPTNKELIPGRFPIRWKGIKTPTYVLFCESQSLCRFKSQCWRCLWQQILEVTLKLFNLHEIPAAFITLLLPISKHSCELLSSTKTSKVVSGCDRTRCDATYSYWCQLLWKCPSLAVTPTGCIWPLKALLSFCLCLADVESRCLTADGSS